MSIGKRTKSIVDMQTSNIQVIDVPNGTQRVLKFGDKLIQGRMNKDGSLSLDYFKQLMYSFRHVSEVKKICILGLGAGCLHRHIHERYPDIQIDTVEILPEIVQIAKEKFYLPDAVNVYVEDARTWIKDKTTYTAYDSNSKIIKPYDIVIVDLYNEDEQIFVDDRDLKRLGKLVAYNSLINKNTYEGYMVRLNAVYNKVYEQFKPELKSEEYNHIAFCQ